MLKEKRKMLSLWRQPKRGNGFKQKRTKQKTERQCVRVSVGGGRQGVTAIVPAGTGWALGKYLLFE